MPQFWPLDWETVDCYDIRNDLNIDYTSLVLKDLAAVEGYGQCSALTQFYCPKAFVSVDQGS